MNLMKVPLNSFYFIIQKISAIFIQFFLFITELKKIMKVLFVFVFEFG